MRKMALWHDEKFAILNKNMDIYDFRALADRWLAEEYLADFSGDGVVSFTDFAVTAENWLTGAP